MSAMSDASVPEPPAEPGLDLASLLGGAQQMLHAQAQAATQELVGEAGGGRVTVTVTGGGQFLAVHLAPEVVDPDDVEMLEDLVLVALQDAMTKVSELQAASMGGLDLGALGGLLGGPA